MAYTTLSYSSSSSSDFEVSTCSKECLKAYATLKEQYDSLTSNYKKSQHNLFSDKAGLQSVEERLVHYKKNKAVFTEKINVLNLEVKLRDKVLAEYTTNLEKAEKERDELKLTLKKLQNSSKSLNTLLDSQDIRSGKGYHEAPPPLTGNYMPLKRDMGLIDEHFESESVDVSIVSLSAVMNVKTVDANHKGVFSKEEPKPVKKNSFSPPIIEDLVFENEEEDEPKFQKQVQPSSKTSSMLISLHKADPTKVNAASVYGYYCLKSMFLEKLQLLINAIDRWGSNVNSIKNSDQPLPRVTQVSIAGTTSTEQPPLKDKSMWSDQEKRVQKIDRLARSLLIQGLPNDIYSLIDRTRLQKTYGMLLRGICLWEHITGSGKTALEVGIDRTFNSQHLCGRTDLAFFSNNRSRQGTTDEEAMINSIKNGDQPLPRVTQVSIAGTTSTEQRPLKDKSMWKAAVLYEYETFKATEGELLLDTYIRYLQVINDLKKCGYSKDNYGLYNIIKQNQGDVNDAMGSNKKTVMVTSDPLALIAEKTNVSRSKEKPTNNNLRTSSSSQSANKKQEFSKTDNKRVEKKDDEKKRDMSKVKCYNCRKEGHFAKDCKKAKSDPGKETVIAAENKHAVPGDWNPLRSAEQADNRQKMLSKAA
nr:hypothetical protein [Tanacetum cinerariifolium]